MRKRLLTIVLLTSLWMVITGGQGESAQAKNLEAPRRDVFNTYPGNKKNDHLHTQWIADPKRGWIRADEGYREKNAKELRSKDKQGDKSQDMRQENRVNKRR